MYSIDSMRKFWQEAATSSAKILYECHAPVEFFNKLWTDIPHEYQIEIIEIAGLPCEGSGAVSGECSRCAYCLIK